MTSMLSRCCKSFESCPTTFSPPIYLPAWTVVVIESGSVFSYLSDDYVFPILLALEGWTFFEIGLNLVGSDVLVKTG